MARTSIQNANASLVFSSSTDVTKASPATGLSSLVSSFSIGGWIKNFPETTFPVIMSLWGGGGNPTGLMLYFSKSSRNLTAKAKIGGTQYDAVVAATRIPIGDWCHIALTFDGTTLTGYMNGLADGTQVTVGGSVATTDNRIELGKNAVGGNTFKGSLLKMFVGPYMNAEQIMSVYQRNEYPSGMVAVYPLSEGAGTIAYDTSGNGNNGTITSPTWTRDAPSKTRKTVNNNLVYNGDFEIAPVVNVAQTGWFTYIDGTTSGTSSITPFGWYAFDKSGTVAALFDSTTKYSGNYSLKLSTTATASFCSVGQIGLAAATGYIKVSPSTSYTYSYWMKTTVASGSATTGARVVITNRNGAGTALTGTNTALITTTTDWTQYTGTVTTSATAVYLSVACAVTGTDGAATLIMDAWFDDITLTPTTATTRTALTKSRVKIQEDNYSVQWPTLGSGFAAATASAALQTLGVSNLNYSGGIWVKELSKRATFGNIIFELQKSSPFKYAFQLRSSNSNKFSVGFYDGTLNPAVGTTTDYPIGSWYHIAFTREGTSVKFYVNGQLKQTQTITIGTATSDQVRAGVNNAFAGNVSDAFIYGSVLTADEIYAIYANDVYPSGALLKAKLNDGTGTTAADQSGNGVDFTLTTPTWSTDTATGERTVVS